MKADMIKTHPVYGEPLHKIKAGNPPKGDLIIMLFCGCFLMAVYFYQPLEDKAWFVAILAGLMFLAVFISLIFDNKDIRLVMYENGIWSHHKI